MGSETQSKVGSTAGGSVRGGATSRGASKGKRGKHDAKTDARRANGAVAKKVELAKKAELAKPRKRGAAARPNGSATPAIPPPPGASQAGSDARLVPVKARPSRSEREFAEARAREIDDVCAAWAAIVAERMAADQQFAETFEQFQTRPRDLRGLFLWDALHAAESHVALVNTVIARHLDGRRADPFAILGELRAEQRQLAVVYAVNAFLAVLNQMSSNKPKWLPMESVDERMAVLALAHQTMEYALEAARIEAPPDLTENILLAAQDESVWSGARDAQDRTLAACAASAAFFRALGAEDLGSIDEVVTAYDARSRSRAPMR